MHQLVFSPLTDAAQQAVEGRRPHLVVTGTGSPVMKYQGLAHLHLAPPRIPDAAAA
jgi:hypothetical protein